MTNRASEDGFTLIEALVALSVISIAAVALISASEATLRRVYDAEIQRAANWVAEAALAKFEMGLAESATSNLKTYGAQFDVSVVVEKIPSSQLEKVTVEVFLRDHPEGVRSALSRHVGFRRPTNSGT